jgi:hypothetical protein
MNKTIKEFNNENYTYKLGYNLWSNKVYPRLEVYKNNKMLSEGGLSGGFFEGLFGFCASYSSSFYTGTADTMKELFIELRKHSEVSQNIEEEYESLFFLYKLNNFKEN